MKKLTKVLALILVIAMAAMLFSGCENKVEALAGTWTATVDDSETEALALLEAIDLYEEEIVLIDLFALDFVKILTFDEQQNYSFAVDPDGTKECVEEYLYRAFSDLYEGRTALNSIYGESFDAMDEATFRQFYADLYGYGTFDEMIDALAEFVYDYESLGVYETGTFTIEDNIIDMKATVAEDSGTVTYKISGDVLTITYSDGTEIYTRVD